MAVSDETKLDRYKKIRKLARKTKKQLDELAKNTDRDNPVDVDIIQTYKAMFYVEVAEILKL